MLIWGTKGREKTIETGVFYCPHCDGEATYEKIRVAKYFTLYFIPIFESDLLGKYVKCRECGHSFEPSVLSIELYECTECGGSLQKSDSYCRHCGADASSDVTGVKELAAIIVKMAAETQEVLRRRLLTFEVTDKNADWETVVTELAGFFLHYTSRVLSTRVPESHPRLLNELYHEVVPLVAQIVDAARLASTPALLEAIGAALQTAEIEYANAKTTFDQRQPLSQETLYGKVALRLLNLLGTQANIFTRTYIVEAIQGAVHHPDFKDALIQFATVHNDENADIPL